MVGLFGAALESGRLYLSVCICIVGSTWRGYDALGESAAGRHLPSVAIYSRQDSAMGAGGCAGT